MSDFNDTILGQNQGRKGTTTYHYLDFGKPNTVFDNNPLEKKKSDFSFLSAENQIKEMEEREKRRAENQKRYLINLSDGEYEILNAAIANSEVPEDEAYRFASALKYSKQFSLPLSYTYEHLEDLNNWWLGPVKKTPKNAFTSIVNSFALGNNTVELGGLGAQLLKAEMNGDAKEIERLNKAIKEIEDDNEYLKDDMPRSWFTKLLQAGAQTIPFSAHVFIPSALGSIIAPGIGTAAGFARSMEMQTGLEYLELKKAGVKPELAKNIAIMSGGLQAVIETSLGNVASFTGKGLGADKIASKVLTKLNAKGIFGNFAKGFLHYSVDSLSEGAEEALQELVSAGAKATAAALQGEGVETDDALTIAGNVWESFKGGIVASVVLGIPGAIKFTKADIQSSNNLRKAALTTPSEKAFINENKDSPALEGLTEEDKKNELHNIYEAKKQEREAFQKLQDKKEYLSDTARIEGEVMRDDKGNIVYERDENGNLIKERDEDGNLKPIPKAYGAPEEVVRLSNGGLYIQEGKTRVRKGGIIEGEYIAGNPTQETEYNDYAHIHYTYNEDKNTVRIDEVAVENPKYLDIVKEFIRDFGEKFKGAKIEWQTKEEALTKIKNELIAENPNGKENGVQYFLNETDEAERRANIKLHDRLKQTMPQLTDTERHTAVSIFNAIASGAGMDTETYLNTYYVDEILTNTPPSNMEAVAAQEHIDLKIIQGTTEFKEIANDIKALVYVSEKSDFSTFVHEAAHVARRTMKGDLLIKAEAAFNVEGGKWTRADEEAFARGFEQYLKEGTAPTEELKTVFQKAAEFLARIYKSLQELLHINDDIRKVYDELLGGEKSVLREAENNIGKTRTKEDRVFIKTVLNTVAEVKQSLERIKNTDIVNKETGITARISSTGINKMTSNKAVEKSEANEFTRANITERLPKLKHCMKKQD